MLYYHYLGFLTRTEQDQDSVVENNFILNMAVESFGLRGRKQNVRGGKNV